jgi:membrane-bound metal-dependent hydrolase YbcI (DUF457 family)
MPNRTNHFIAGALTTAVAYGLKKRISGELVDPGEMLFLSLGGGGAACLPDILEPADNPNHRQLFHNFIVLCGLGLGLDHILKNDNTQNSPYLPLALMAGYGSHLVIDGLTPIGLPL